MSVVTAVSATGGAPILPSRAGAAHGRNLLAMALGTVRRLRVQGVHHVPRQGPFLLLPAGGGIAAGLVLQAASPRPVHVLVPSAAWVPPWDRLLAAAGWLPIDLAVPDRRGLHRAVGTLVAGAALALPVEVPGGRPEAVRIPPQAAYLIAHARPAIVPVLIAPEDPASRSGTPRRLPRRTVRDVVFGAPLVVDVPGEPYRRAVLARVSEQVRQGVADALAAAEARTHPWAPNRGAIT